MRTWARVAVITLCATAAAALATVPSATADRIGEDHLPNLVTRRPLGIRISHEGGTMLLRFSNTVANKGDGPLELRPENTGETTTAFQRVFTHGESGAWVMTSEREVGTFVFHPQHDHWHFEAFAEYQLRRVTATGDIGAVLRESQDKVSFCVADALSIYEGLPHASPTATYPIACAQSAIQGLSVGWADRYSWRLYGQWIDVTGLPYGTYWLTSRADPLDLIDETNETDNRAALRIRITADGVERA